MCCDKMTGRTLTVPGELCCRTKNLKFFRTPAGGLIVRCAEHSQGPLLLLLAREVPESEALLLQVHES